MAKYIVTDTSLSSIADAIRNKGNTVASLAFPSGFVSAINDISAGGGDSKEDEIIARTISRSYINNTILKIGIYAFASCINLTTVSFPEVTTIGSYAFTYCTSLTTVSFPKATTIGASAFQSCINLTTVSFPKVTTIGSSAFGHCGSLTTVSFPEVTTIGASAFANCGSLTTVSFPKVTTISNYAFSSCTNLTTVSFPKATNIGNYAFGSCYKLISLYLLNNSIVSLTGSKVFNSSPIGGYSASAGRFGSVFVPQSLLTQYQSATNWTSISSRIVGLTASQVQELTS